MKWTIPDSGHIDEANYLAERRLKQCDHFGCAPTRRIRGRPHGRAPFSPRFRNSPDPPRALPPRQPMMVYVSRRQRVAAQLLSDRDSSSILNVAGGFNAWTSQVAFLGEEGGALRWGHIGGNCPGGGLLP